MSRNSNSAVEQHLERIQHDARHIMHGVNELRCGNEVIRQQLEHLREMVAVLGSASTVPQETIDRVNALAAKARESAAALQADVDTNQPPPPEPPST